MGDERIFNVEDKVWLNNRVVSTTTSQLREQITEAYRDAAGAMTYKVVRARRATAAEAWRVDSAQTLTVAPQYLLLTRSNLRTVELLYPVRDGQEWNKNAFDSHNAPNDLNRRYQEVGGSLSAGGRTYANTVTTFDEGDDPLFNAYWHTLRQVYARGVGPVLREAIYYNYCSTSAAVIICSGKEHVETLVP
ncbi:hypothetical protein [Hymenobacter sp. CRA2]|uniref:hypothetical protein n=1 Tax=Hymenobacter sp. CRA2 TaxID=1955620 RepID=UPI00098FC6C2|nr:hypothetical protein [Hymenobacter sp. CRA2]OON67617.1 hypothetical protein B0919_17475 [Hymenobacter sp. CRA2]